MKIKRKKATQLVVDVLASNFKKELICDLKTNLFSLIIDETTDITVQKSLILIVRYWDDGCIKDRILDLIEISDGLADTIFTAIKNLFDKNEIPYNNILAFAADGAAAMMGALSGVQTKFKEIAPHIYIQKSLCHLLHLCSFYSSKKLPNVVE